MKILNSIKQLFEDKVDLLDLDKGKGYKYKGINFINYTELHHSESALYRLAKRQILFLVFIFFMIGLGIYLNWHATLVFLISILTIVYFADLLFNLFLIYRSFFSIPEIKISPQEIENSRNREWPMYTILCPLYKEYEMLRQFINAINDLDYPKDKLQVLFLLEEDDDETVSRAKNITLPPNYEILIVPNSLPKTKPKALNYGLQRAKGEYAVIYDAEDIPEKSQLKKAILAFEKSDKNVICMQAKLNFYNPRHNFLTRMFTAEYSLWFDLVLTGLQSINAPIPLGGTSNHFKTENLKILKGWDAFNVTEDCDLGIRLFKKGYRTAIIDSETLEEANSHLFNWFNQRSRWIKGYIQTYFVHMRKPKELMTDWKDPQIIAFQLIVGGKILSMFINPLMWIITISYFSLRAIVGPTIESFYPSPILYMAVFSLALGNFLYLYYYIIGCAKRDYDDIMKYALLIPFYWLAMSVAGWKAVWQMFFKPHYWAKTKHGYHLKFFGNKNNSNLITITGKNI